MPPWRVSGVVFHQVVLIDVPWLFGGVCGIADVFLLLQRVDGSGITTSGAVFSI